jgi:hypothetical protein
MWDNCAIRGATSVKLQLILLEVENPNAALSAFLPADGIVILFTGCLNWACKHATLEAAALVGAVREVAAEFGC